MVEELYYYADGQRIPLRRSRRFVARTAAREELGVDDRQPGRIAATAADPQRHGQPLTVPRLGIAIVPADETSEDAGSSKPLTAAGEARRSGVPPVYETTDDLPAEQVLVPTGELIIMFRAELGPGEARRRIELERLRVVREDYPEPNAWLVEVEPGHDPVTTANTWQERDDITYAQPNFVHLVPRLAPTAPPRRRATAAAKVRTNDPALRRQWNLKAISAPEAWTLSMGKRDVIIAVVDEGNDLRHEDLSYVRSGYDAYDGDDRPQAARSDAHGTACAGIAAARADNAKGGAGVAPKCRIMAVRIARGTGGGWWDTSDAIVADGIRTAVDRGADVLSHSYQTPPSTVVTRALRHAAQAGRGGKGCPMAAATGNDDVRWVNFPAHMSTRIPGLLAVGASNEWDERKSMTSRDGESWWGSNYGPEVDVIAPGVHVHTTDMSARAGYGPGSYIRDFNGTSSATPHVAGLAALILSIDPDLRAWEVKDIIRLTATRLGRPAGNEQTGHGRVNAYRALLAAARVWPEITVRPVFSGPDGRCELRASVRLRNVGINVVRLDRLTLVSRPSAGRTVLGRFDDDLGGGRVLAPGGNQTVRFDPILLPGEGDESAWSLRWTLSWRYTYWRPQVAGRLPGVAVVRSRPGIPVRPRPQRGAASG
ncbi:MAG: S8 family serine peptidase [Egibacteraceae bacterium]